MTNNRAGDHGGGVVVCRNSIEEPSVAVTVDGNVIAGNTAIGASGISGSGGGLYLSGTAGWVHHNTIVDNSGIGTMPGTGGGIVLDTDDSLIENNIIAFSKAGGSVTCVEQISTTQFRSNLIWANEELDRACRVEIGSDGNLAVDPLICGFETGDYRVAENSPCLLPMGGYIGAFQAPGCPARTAALETTWGSVKARFGSHASPRARQED